MNNIILKDLLSLAFQKEQKGSLKHLRSVLEISKYKNNNLARELVAKAHIACFSLDAREISFAIKTFSELEEYNELENILRLCKAYKVFKPILEIIKLKWFKNQPNRDHI